MNDIFPVSSPAAASSAAAAIGAKGITLLLCGYNSAERLPATLRALAGLAVPTPPFGVELLVIDNASADNTSAVAQRTLRELGPFFSYGVLTEPRAGKSHALERGFARARYRYVCIVDDDNWLAPDYLNLAWEIMETNPQIGALGGVGEAVCETPPPAWFADYALDYAADRQAAQSGDVTVNPGFVFGAGCLIRLAAWRRVQAAGFRSLLVKHPGVRSSGEDVEMCYALALAGYRIWFDERLRFRHLIPANRLTWAYLCSLYESNAGSEADLRPYRHFLQQLGAAGPFIWLRNGLYVSRYVWHYARQALPTGAFRSAVAAEGNQAVLRATYFRRVLQHYLAKELRRDAGFAQVTAFVDRLRTLSS